MSKLAELEREQPAALHRRIASDIEAEIASGAWPPGYRIPFEHELTQKYRCARATVNKALSALAAEGLIHRRRGSGSFVAPPRVHALVVEIPDIEAEISKRGQRYGYRLLSRQRRQPRADKVAEVDLSRGGELLCLRCLHFADDQPFSLERRLISLAIAPEAGAADFEHVSPSSWLVQNVAWTAAEHRIMAVNADAESAVLLDIPPNTACLAVDRATWNGGDQITQVLNLFSGDSYDLIARFNPPHRGL
ncbi:MAG TPA: histidine utilization repressor [Caulobacteraceae bacterium]|jgi:GntR family histidine utilization transcriptional repressor